MEVHTLSWSVQAAWKNGDYEKAYNLATEEEHRFLDNLTMTHSNPEKYCMQKNMQNNLKVKDNDLGNAPYNAML